MSALIDDRLRPAAIVLFGSQVTGRARPESDVDFGVLVGREAPDAFGIAQLKTELEAAMGQEVDVVVLDSASAILAMEVLRSHRLLAGRDPEAFEAFIVRTLSAYFDLKRTRAPIERAILSPESAVTADSAVAKLASIERCLERIRSVTRDDPESIDDIDVEGIVVLNLQRAIQATIDLAAHVVAGRRWGLPDSLRAHERIDRAILKAIVRDHLTDLEEFSRAIKSLLA